MVALTTTSDGQSVSTNQTAQTQLTFTALSHSENYTVSVVAVNSLGQQGLSAVGTFRTRDIREPSWMEWGAVSQNIELIVFLDAYMLYDMCN